MDAWIYDNNRVCIGSLVLTLGVLFSFVASLGGTVRADFSHIERYVQAEMDLNQIPGLSLAVVRDSNVLFARAYGVRDVATGEPMSVETLVDLASVSKSFTALAVWKLKEAGLLELDAPVAQYLPQPEAGKPDALAGVTVRHLLQHRSGLTRRGDYLAPCCGVPEQADLALAARKIRAAKRPRPAGSSFRYANRNYVLLAAIVERLSDESFPAFMQAHVFAPLGMTRTTLDHAQARHWGLAAYHERQWGRVRPSPSEFSGWYGASGIKSNALDMARYALAILNGGKTGVERVLSSAPFSGDNRSAYEMGWFITSRAKWLNNTAVRHHTGDIWGANSAIMLAPNLQSGVVVLVNLGAHRAGDIARGVLTRAMGLPGPPPGRVSWTQIPDNWAILSTVASGFILLLLARQLTAAPDQFRKGERRVQWAGDWFVLMRAFLLAAMAAYLAELVFAGGTPLSAFPTTMRTALPLLTGAVVALLVTNAVLSFAPRRKT